MYSDDFSKISQLVVDYDFNNKNIEDLCGSPINFSEIDNVFADLNAGMNSFDFVILNNYIKEKGIKKVTELGCGSTSQFLDMIGVQRKTFALTQAAGSRPIEYIQCDIFKNSQAILESAEDSDMILIDSLHSYEMSSFYYEKILSICKKPVFMHDIFDKNKNCYSEQTFWEEHIAGKSYNLIISSNAYPPQRTDEIYPQVCAIWEPIFD